MNILNYAQKKEGRIKQNQCLDIMVSYNCANIPFFTHSLRRMVNHDKKSRMANYWKQILFHNDKLKIKPRVMVQFL